jgi:hypothetical protein
MRGRPEAMRLRGRFRDTSRPAWRQQSHLAYQVGIVSKVGRQLGLEALQLVAMLRSFARLTEVLESLEARPGLSPA